MRAMWRGVVVCVLSVLSLAGPAQLLAQALPDDGRGLPLVMAAAATDVVPAFTVSIDSVNPGANVERSACVTVAIRVSLAYECGDLRLTYGLQAKRFRNQVRAPAMLYNSQHARPTPVVRVLVMPTSAWPGGAPSSLTATLRVKQDAGAPAVIRRTKTWSGAELAALASGPALLALSFDATDLPTNLYPVTVEVTMNFGSGSTSPETASGELAIVNRKGSEFGAGWWVAGYERLQRLSDTTLFWIGGDGSTRRYTYHHPSSQGKVYTARALTGLDSLTERVDSGTFRRHLSRGAFVHFTPSGRHDRTVSSVGAVTRFDSGLCTFLTGITLTPPGTGTNVGQNWGFWYEGYDWDDPCALYDPSNPTAWYERLNTITGSNSAVWRFIYPDSGSFVRQSGAGFSTAERYAYTEQNGRIRTYRDPFGTEVRIGWDASTGTIVSDSIVLDATHYIVHGYRAGEIAAVAQPILRDSAYTRLTGPRTDLLATTKLAIGAFGQPTRITNPLGHTTQVTYSAAFPLLATQVIAPGGHRTTASYDPLGRVTTVQADGVIAPDFNPSITQYAYDPSPQFADLLISRTDPTGVVTRYGYGQIIGQYPVATFEQVGNDSTRRTKFDYCLTGACRGLLSSVTSPVNGPSFRRSTDVYEYDAYGNLSATQTAGGKRVEYRYDNFYGRLVATRTRIATPPNARWVTDTIAYDALDRVASTLTSADAEGPTPYQYVVTTTTYVGASRVPQKVQRYANTTLNTIGVLEDRYRYDSLGRVIETYAQGASRTVPEKLVYDAAGNVTRRISPTGDTLRMEYDVLNRLTKRTAPSVAYGAERVGSANFAVTDTLRSPAFPRLALSESARLVVDADVAQYTYDDTGTKTGQLRTAENQWARTARTYCANGWVQTDTQRLRNVLDADFGHVYGISYAYDLAGRRTAVNHPMQLASGFATWQEWTAYSPTTGLPLWTRDLSMQAKAYTYDAAEQLIRDSAPGGIVRVLEYSLDGEPVTDQILNQSSNAAAPLPQQGGSLRLATLAYDARGKLTSVADIGGLPFQLSLSYSPLGHLRGSTSSSYTYDAAQTLGNVGTSSSTTTDALGHVLVSSGSTTSATYSPTFGSGTSGTAADPRANSFASDSSGRLVLSVTSVGRDSTRYDAKGNVRLQLSRDIGRTQPNGPIPETSERAHYYNSLGQLVAVDARKAPTAPIGVDSSTYRADHYLLTFDTYRYDALGRRVQVRSQRACPADSDFGAECKLGSVQRTVWDGSRELWEIRMPDSASYVDRDSLLPTSIGLINQQSPVAVRLDLTPHFGRVGYVYGGTVDRPVAVLRADYGDHDWLNPGYAGPKPFKRFQPFVAYPQWDQRGEPGLGSTSDGGAWPCEGVGASQRCTYPLPWSGLWGPNGVALLSTSRVWLGSLVRDKREANGLLYRRNRYLDPATGRFTQPDPIGLAGGLNSYGFAGGDPVNYSDPFGLCPDDQPLCHWLKATLIAAGTDIGFVAGGGSGLLTGPGALVATPAGAIAGAGAGAAGGAVLGEIVDRVFFSKSDHAKKRATQGRPVREGSGDVQRANESDVFVQENGRIVVRGARGREQVFEPTGEQVTSVVRPNAAHLQRLRDGILRPATSAEFEAFRSLFR